MPFFFGTCEEAFRRQGGALSTTYEQLQHTEWDDTRFCKYTIVLLKMSTAMLETY
jgi:hypothetical protein